MSRLPSKWNVWSISLLALLVIGIFYHVIQRPLSFIIPIVVLGGIFLLYKYPPSFIRGNSSQQGRTYVKQSRTAASRTKPKKPRSKTVPFRVIEGGKEDDDLPKYH
ncbi:hypothetical protein BK133_13030 [Paenibacillus sp. FSL H8-0548]|uniref:hypothetical protein n=1 Tax=Paenibacillus sp. FSL H8-0548 TaxID=1920422 RepID=UPI00096F45B4|nr:hypothetical protein [Paenibacillus sp. FSL H8-0548]OMF34236.1 hypothetical protein BK133_13030 [Paenibacillus sp. FSL H8-0548]